MRSIQNTAFFFLIYIVYLIHFIPSVDDIFYNGIKFYAPFVSFAGIRAIRFHSLDKIKSLKEGEYGARQEFDHKNSDRGLIKFQ